MDVVIAYVNPNDFLWQELYNKYENSSNEAYKSKRFRDTSSLKYVLRSIHKYAKFVNNVHLVVQSESQVPDWIDRESVNVVLHKDFIPEEYLPTFNCNTIESFLHKIPNLADRFVYFNDDMILNRPCSLSDFYVGNLCNIFSTTTRRLIKENTWYNCQYNNTKVIDKVFGNIKDDGVWNIFPHTVTPLYKPLCEEAYNVFKEDIHSRITRFRELNNFNQHFYAYYIEQKKGTSGKSISVNYLDISAYNELFLRQSYAQTLCVNDSVTKDEKVIFNNHKKIAEDLDKKFNFISKYEKGYEEEKRDSNDIDGIMLYVDFTDKEWYERYQYYKSLETNQDIKSLSDERVRDLLGLKYTMRSISEHMPFIKKMHLIVQSESQVPDWIDRENVNVVLHKDFIPEEYLPTFNNHTIEMFLHKIPNLADRYIVFNDDMFMMKDIKEEDIFDGMIPIDMFFTSETEKIAYHYDIKDVFYDRFPTLRKHPHINNNLLAFDYNNISYDTTKYYYPSHGFTCLNKQFVEDVYSKFEKTIKDSCTRFRADCNMYSYAYRLCSFLKYKKLFTLTTKFFTFSKSIGDLSREILEDKYDCICLNDDGLNSEYEKYYKDVLINLLSKKFYKKSKYERDIKNAVCVISNEDDIISIEKWINHYEKIGFDNIIFYDNSMTNKIFNGIKKYINDGFVIYVDYKNKIDRQKLSAYKNCYEVYSKNFDWIAFFDIDEYICIKDGKSIKEYLLNDKFNDFNIIQLNRKSYISDNNIKKSFDNEFVKSIIRTKNKNITFYNTFANIYPYCTYSPNPKYEMKVCDCDGNVVANDPFMNKDNTEYCYIKHLFCTSFNDLLRKIKNGFPKENIFCKKSLTLIEKKLKTFFNYVEISEDKIQKINSLMPYLKITKDILLDIPYDGVSDIDYVFPFVNDEDEKWIKEYEYYKQREDGILNYKNSLLKGQPRYKNYDLLKYKLRSLEMNMPWLRNIYIIVSSNSQIPKWLNTNKVKVVLHTDIIPKEFLPLFNSSAIEMFLGNIKGLSEKFIYGNDDFYVMKRTSPYMFFRGEYSLKDMNERSTIPVNEISANGICFRQNGLNLATQDLNLKLKYLYQPGHGICPMHKSTCEYFLNNYKNELYSSISKFRKDNNYNQYLYSYYDITHYKSIPYNLPYYSAYIGDDRERTQKLINAFNKKSKYEL